MSRLRKRTWTARERAVAWALCFHYGDWGAIAVIRETEKSSAARRGFAALEGCSVNDAILPGLESEYERTMRVKGYDAESIEDLDHRIEARNGQWDSRNPEADRWHTIADEREERHWNIPGNYWTEHPDNPNILIRREND